MGLDNFTKHQQGIIKRYYSNQDGIQLQRLAELVTDLYLAEGKKKEKLWKSIATTMEKLEVPKERAAHLMKTADPALVAKLVQELQSK